ncbi:MAG TPA: DMT family transporter [Flavobacteriaceae bacterium]|nr:DMT family transporter [Flavobacteriaceae bacterium]
MKNSTLLGGILVAIGAASYGMLTTFVKLAEEHGYNMYEITITEYIIGTPALFIVDYLFRKRKNGKSYPKPTRRNIRNLMLAGATMGSTTFVYYLTVQYIPVSVAIVLLMQSVWIGVLIDAIIHKTKPDRLKLIAVVMVLGGTALATNLFFAEIDLDWRGIGLGFLTAISYSITIFATNKVGLGLSTPARSKYMTLGAFILVIFITTPFLIGNFQVSVLYTWGIFFGVFGAFLPPLLLNYGMPKVNLGVGAIITSMELPVAVALAYFLLNEHVNVYQLFGIVLILIAVTVMNLREIRNS